MWKTHKRMCICVYGKHGCPYTENAVKKLVELNWPFRYNGIRDDQSPSDFFEDVKAVQQKLGCETVQSFPQIIIWGGSKSGKGTKFDKSAVIDSSSFLSNVEKDDDPEGTLEIISRTLCEPVGTGCESQVHILNPNCKTSLVDKWKLVQSEMSKDQPDFMYRPVYNDETGLESVETEMTGVDF